MDEGRPAPDENEGMRLPRQTGQGLRRQDCRQAEPARKPHFSLGHGYGQEIPGWVNFIEPAPGKDTLHAVTGPSPTLAKGSRKKERKRWENCPKANRT